MKKLIKFFLLSVVLLFITQAPASAESLQDNLVPQDSNQKIVGEVELKYNQYPQHHYKLDTWVDTSGDWKPWNWADGAGKQIYIGLMEIINSVWNVNVLLANFTMMIVQEAFELDFVSGVVDQIGQAVQNIAGFGPSGFMSNGLWPLLVTFIIGIVGAWATYVGMVKRETSRAWGGLLSSLVIFVFALGFFSNASTFLKEINEWSSNLQSDILAVSASVVNPGSSYSEKEGIATIRNQMFDLMVKKPYLLMQYGTTKVDEGRVNDLLSVDPILKAEDRQKKAEVEVKEKDNAMMSIDGISQRAGFVPLLFLANSIIGIFLLIVSGTIILYQMIFLVLVLFAPVSLLMALVPRWSQTAFDWLMKVVHAQLMKIAIALLLTILFGISAILYRATNTGDLGYLGMMLLQIVCFLGVWAKRKDLFSMVSTAVTNVQSSTGATLQGYKQKYSEAKNTVRKAKNAMTDGKDGTRYHPLGQRRIGVQDKDQLVDRKKQVQAAKDGLKSGVAGAKLTDRTNEEFKEGQEMYKNRTDVEKSAAAGREQLMNRKEKETTDQNGTITSIDDIRHRKGRIAENIPLEDRLQGASREVAASVDQASNRDVELIDRQHSQQNIHLKNQHSHEDRINEHQSNKLSESRMVERTTDREVSQNTINRERITTNHNERNTKEVMNRHSVTHENHDRTHTIKIDPSKPITQWEAQQQINERNRSKKE